MTTTEVYHSKNSEHRGLKFDPITNRYMPYGNGCRKCANCFECIFEKDCKASSERVNQ